MEVDEALGRLGTWGLWQVIYFLMLSTATMFPACWNMLAIVFNGKHALYVGYTHALTTSTVPCYRLTTSKSLK